MLDRIREFFARMRGSRAKRADASNAKAAGLPLKPPPPPKAEIPPPRSVSTQELMDFLGRIDQKLGGLGEQLSEVRRAVSGHEARISSLAETIGQIRTKEQLAKTPFSTGYEGGIGRSGDDELGRFRAECEQILRLLPRLNAIHEVLARMDSHRMEKLDETLTTADQRLQVLRSALQYCDASSRQVYNTVSVLQRDLSGSNQQLLERATRAAAELKALEDNLREYNSDLRHSMEAGFVGETQAMQETVRQEFRQILGNVAQDAQSGTISAEMSKLMAEALAGYFRLPAALAPSNAVEAPPQPHEVRKQYVRFRLLFLATARELIGSPAGNALREAFHRKLEELQSFWDELELQAPDYRLASGDPSPAEWPQELVDQYTRFSRRCAEMIVELDALARRSLPPFLVEQAMRPMAERYGLLLTGPREGDPYNPDVYDSTPGSAGPIVKRLVRSGLIDPATRDVLFRPLVEAGH